MWWHGSPETDVLTGQIERLRGAWRESRLPNVVAIGSTWDEEGRRVLFVGVDEKADPRPALWAYGSTPLDALTRWLIRHFGPVPAPAWRQGEEPPRTAAGALLRFLRVLRLLIEVRLRSDVLNRELVSVGLKDADEITREQLISLDAPYDTRVGYLGPLRLVSRTGTRLYRETRDKATAGCVVDADAGLFVSTAGHLGATPGERLYFLRKGLFRSSRIPAGQVEAMTSPLTPDIGYPGREGVDFAAVRPDAAYPLELHPVDVADAEQIQENEHLVWNGGITGHREGWVASMLTECRGGNVEHRNTIRVMGPRNGAATEGDSGTAAYRLRGELVGHIVGTEGYRYRSIGQAALVQDARTGFDYFENRVGSIRAVLREPERRS